MAATGRKKDPIWLYFDEGATVLEQGIKAKCKICEKAMMELVARMKKQRILHKTWWPVLPMFLISRILQMIK